MTITSPTFTVITGTQVSTWLTGREPAIVDLVRDTYLRHEDRRTVNPPSYFLRFPDRPTARIIALPASISADPGASGEVTGVDGIKWIASVPANVEHDLPRASAVTILNDPVTGHPYACVESSIISSARTAASAALAARELTADRPAPRRLGIVGAGVIARDVFGYLAATDWEFDQIAVHDLAADRSKAFVADLADAAPASEVAVADDIDTVLRSSDLIVFTTVAPTPHVTDPSVFEHHPVVLHVSLRDLATPVIRSAFNVVDDVDHVMQANTSVHLTEQETGNRDFVGGTLAQVMRGEVTVPADRTIVFSPFGLGVLDLAVARHIHDALKSGGELQTVPGFFPDTHRIGATR